MRIIDINIENWRNLHDVKIQAPEDAKLICLIGENGTGKSNILELISSSAFILGISPGVNIPRGNPIDEKHSYQVSIKFNETVDELLEEERVEHYNDNEVIWNGVLQVISFRDENTNNQEIVAGGSGNENLRKGLAVELITKLRERENTHYLSLDADRSYPKLSISASQYAQALSQDWENPKNKKNQAFKPTRTMYEEWIKYFLAKETQDATTLQQNMRRAKEQGEPQPEFIDGFEPYKNSVRAVLPHLNFVGVDSTSKTLVFDSSGMELKFTNLSGGEKEIAFIIGQFERFQLHQGVLLIDEPELHLNPDLLRNWVAYLRDSVDDGQVWISTHSLEAVETAGPAYSFVLQRELDSRLVSSIELLSDSPILSVLSAAVGSPAFSLSKLKFIYIEGDGQGRERERCFRLFGDSTKVRFIEGGGCFEVSKKLAAVKELASETGKQLKVGGIIDSDFKSPDMIESLQQRTPVFVLGVHEIENFFLQLSALEVIGSRSGIDTSAVELLKDASDRFAGKWVLQRSLTIFTREIEVDRSIRQVADITWEIILQDEEVFKSSITSRCGFAENEEIDFKTTIQESIDEYKTVRESDDLWKNCMGKETMGIIFAKFGMSSVDSLQNNVLDLWRQKKVEMPQELLNFRDYINNID